MGAYATDGGPGGGSDAGINLWAASFAAVLVSLILGSICVVTTVAGLRARGMSMSMVPMFSWSMLVAGTVWILSLPVLAATLVLVYVDHQYGQQSFGLEADMYERIIWALRQPQVYAYAVPALGIITDSIVTLSGRKLSSRPAAMGAIGLAGALGFGAFLQRPINPDAVEEPLFVILSILAILPVLGLFGLWADVLRRGERRIASPLVFSLAAGLMLLVATLVGATIAIPAFDLMGPTAEDGQSHYALLAPHRRRRRLGCGARDIRPRLPRAGYAGPAAGGTTDQPADVIRPFGNSRGTAGSSGSRGVGDRGHGAWRCVVVVVGLITHAQGAASGDDRGHRLDARVGDNVAPAYQTRRAAGRHQATPLRRALTARRGDQR